MATRKKTATKSASETISSPDPLGHDQPEGAQPSQASPSKPPKTPTKQSARSVGTDHPPPTSITGPHPLGKKRRLASSSNSSQLQEPTISPFKPDLGYIREALNLVVRASQLNPKHSQLAATIETYIEGKQTLEDKLYDLQTQFNQFVTQINQRLNQQCSLNEPPAKQPSAEQPSAEQPSAEQSSVEQPSVEQPSADQSSADQPLSEQHAPLNQTTQNTWAQVVGKKKQKGKEKSTQQPISKPGDTPSANNDQRSERLILILNKDQPGGTKIDPYSIRNKINLALDTVAVSAVFLTQSGNLALQLAPNQHAEQLTEKQDLWLASLNLPIQRIEKPGDWPKLIAHGVPRKVFETTDGGFNSSLFKSELKTFNKANVQGEAKWLVKPSEYKLAGSVVFAVETEAQKSLIHKTGLIVAGLNLKVENLKPFGPTTICFHCQGYGHNPHACKRTAKCKYCGENHLTKHHSCRICQSSLPCSHLKPRCANCQGPHQAHSPDCETHKVIRPNTKSKNSSTQEPQQQQDNTTQAEFLNLLAQDMDSTQTVGTDDNMDTCS